MLFAPRSALWQGAVLGGMLFLWIGLSWLLVVSRGDPEGLLRAMFARSSRPDAFDDLNRATVFCWVVHSCLALAAVAAARLRRPDVLVVLLIGPVMGLIVGLSTQRWSDPAWAVFEGVCFVGWFAGILVGLVYWGARPRNRDASRFRFGKARWLGLGCQDGCGSAAEVSGGLPSPTPPANPRPD